MAPGTVCGGYGNCSVFVVVTLAMIQLNILVPRNSAKYLDFASVAEGTDFVGLNS